MYHLNHNGDAGECRAVKGNCPFGGAEEHFKSASEARYSFEAKQGSFVSLKPQKKTLSKEAEGELHDNAFNSEDHEIEYTPEEVSQKYEADIHGRTFALTQKMNPGEPGLVLERLFGKEPDSDPTADLGTVELKTKRASSLHKPVTLGSLHMEGDIRKLRQKYLGESFQHSLKAGEWSQINGNYYSLLVDRKQRKVRVIIADRNKQFVSTNDFGWSFDSLDQKVDKKLTSVAIGLYETDEDAKGQRSVTFKDMLMGGFTHESMIDKLESGQVNIDFRFSGRYSSTSLMAKAEDFCDTSKLAQAA